MNACQRALEAGQCAGVLATGAFTATYLFGSLAVRFDAGNVKRIDQVPRVVLVENDRGTSRRARADKRRMANRHRSTVASGVLLLLTPDGNNAGTGLG